MEDREASCEERIGGHLAGRMEDLAKLVVGEPVSEAGGELGGEDERREQASNELWEYPLSVELVKVVRVDLSTGGPADWLELFYQGGDSRPSRIVYHFADWFDHAERTLDGDEFDTIEAAFGDLIDGLES